MSDGDRDPKRTMNSKKVTSHDMFRPLSIAAAKESRYLDKEKVVPPLLTGASARRNKLSQLIMHRISCMHTTNEVPANFRNKDYIRQTFRDLDVSPDMEWLEAGVGETGWISVHGLKNPQHEGFSKLVLSVMTNRTMIIDLRTVSTSGGIPDRVRFSLESRKYLLIGKNISAQLIQLNISTSYCLDVGEVILSCNSHPLNFFRMPQTRLADFGHWLYPLLWYEEYMGYLTPAEFADLEQHCMHPMVRKWPWGKDSRSKQWGLVLTGVQVSYARNSGLANFVSLLTYCLMEMGTDNVSLGPSSADKTTALELPPACSWSNACKLLCQRFRKSAAYQGRQVPLQAPARLPPCAREVELALHLPCCVTQEEERTQRATLSASTRVKIEEKKPIHSRLGYKIPKLTRSKPPTGVQGSSGRVSKLKDRTNRVQGVSQVNADLVEAHESDMPSSSDTKVLPRRFMETPEFGNCCQYCGQRRADKHRTQELCPEYLAKRKRWGRDPSKWSGKSCTYLFCTQPATHLVKMCPDLHSRCFACNVRGHRRGPLCRKDNLRLGSAYKTSAPNGYLTGAGLKESQWQFAPPVAALAEVGFMGKIHQVDWTEEEHEEYAAMTNTEKRRKLSQEYHR